MSMIFVVPDLMLEFFVKKSLKHTQAIDNSRIKTYYDNLSYSLADPKTYSAHIRSPMCNRIFYKHVIVMRKWAVYCMESCLSKRN